MINNSLLSKPGDGPISLLINRKVSRLISQRIATRVTPNQATALALMLGAFSAVLYAGRLWLWAGITLQLSSIVSGVDGEIARLQSKGSNWGDFWDTIADRVVEYLAILGMIYGLSQTFGTQSFWAGLFLLCAIFLLTTSSEKFRSTTGKNYPKQEFDHYFAWISAGRDARIFLLAVGSVLTLVSLWTLMGVIIGLAVIGHLNFLLRFVVIKSYLKNVNKSGA